MRDWEPPPSGEVEIIGLQKGNPNTREIFDPSTSSSEFLQARLDPELGLPPDFSKLLVVRAGETLMESVEDTVKKSLSGTDMLGSVIDSIEAVVRRPDTYIGDGVVHANNTGLIRKHRNLEEETEELRSLREEFINSKGLRLEGLNSEIAT